MCGQCNCKPCTFFSLIVIVTVCVILLCRIYMMPASYQVLLHFVSSTFCFFFVSLCIFNRRRNWCARFGTPQELKYSTRWALVLVYWRQWAAITVFTTTCTGWKYFQIVQFVTDSMTAIGCNVRCSANSAVNGDRKFRYSKKRNFIS